MKHAKKHQGASTLIITFILVMTALLVILFSVQNSFFKQKTSANYYSASQATQAAQAGIEYALAYLQNNSATVVASPSGGYITYNIAKVTLANNASYTVKITNPTINTYNLLTITSTGVSADGSSTNVLTQQAAPSSPGLPATMTATGNVFLTLLGSITGNPGIDAGGTVTRLGLWSINSVIQRDATINTSTLFNNVFSATKSVIQGISTYFSNSAIVPFGTISGFNWVDSSVLGLVTYTIGTPTNPAVMIVNGDFSAIGFVTVNGLLYVLGNITVTGLLTINGAIVSEGNITMAGGSIGYNPTVLSQLASGWGKIPGSWADF